MSDPFLAEVRIFGCNFAPRGWATCDGQLMPISQNTALFSLLGVNFGGNGVSNFGLPDLRDSFAVGTGQGPGLADRVLGETDGSAAVTLQTSQIPPHGHALLAASAAVAGAPAGMALAPTANASAAYRLPGSQITTMAASAVAPAGGALPHENRSPALALNFCIALQGIFPPRP
jgi:microcystin-dependent protein